MPNAPKVNYDGNVFIWFYKDKTAIGQNRNKQ